MATLVLTAVGTAVGGPIGGAIGAILGQRADAEIFKPKGRQGPRLGELAVQTSSYGAAIPQLFGSMRVAGTVIWATDLKEDRTSAGGGKGRPKTTNYSYSASFAVALSGRAIGGVSRIWADGKLLRGAGGDFKTATVFRLYSGSEDQEADPLIASIEGVGATPAFRGTAYAVFEDFQLADYGNHIPSLTFEVVADAGPVTIGAIAEMLSGEAVVDGGTPEVNGYAASGDSIRGAIEALADVVPVSLSDEGDRLRMKTAHGPPLMLDPIQLGVAHLGAAVEGANGASAYRRRAAGTIPSEVSVTYYDIARDYQAGLQRASRGGASSRADQRSLAAAVDAGMAKAIAEHRLATLWTGRATATVNLPISRLAIRPGRHVRIAERQGIWKVARSSLERMVATLELVQVPPRPLGDALPASSGQPVVQPDRPHGPTTLVLLDLPLGDDLASGRPHLLVAAAGAEEGWRRAELTASYDGGGSWEAAGSTAAPAVIGSALSVLAAGGSALIDARGSVEVVLLNDSMWLEGRSDAALAGGANLAALGNELIQFGDVEPLGGGAFRLSRLLRGRRGTEWASGTHASGEAFVLIERQSLAVLEPPPGAVGGEARLIGHGIGDAEAGIMLSLGMTGEILRPPSPVHLRAVRRSGGDIDISWVRRSRQGWTWASGSDTPLGEETERYRLTLSGARFERSVTLSAPAYTYTFSEQAADGLAGPLSVAAAQIGTAASSRESRHTLI